MNIGAIGQVQTEIMHGKISTPNKKPNGKFSSLLSVITGKHSLNGEGEQLNELSEKMSHLLNVLDVQIEGSFFGLQRESTLNTATNLADISITDLFSSMKSILDIMLSSQPSNGKEKITELMNQLNQLTDEEIDEFFVSFLELFTTHFNQLVSKVPSTDLQNVVKTAKYFEHVLSFKDSSSNLMEQQLKDLLKSLKQSLNEQLKNNNGYLKSTFEQILTRSNHKVVPQVVVHSPVNRLNVQSVPSYQSELSPVSLSLPQMTKPEQLVLMMENSRPVTPEQLMKQFESILAKGSFLRSGGIQSMTIQLHPEHLGTLRIELLQQQHGMTARFLASSAMAKEMIESQIHSLKHAFIQQNIQVERLEVSTQIYQQDNRPYQQNEREQQPSEQRKENETKQDDFDNDSTFNQSLQDAILNIEV